MFEGIGAVSKTLKTIVVLKDKAEILEAISPLLETINDAQREATEALSKIHELTQENITLKEELDRAKEKHSIKSQYEIHTFERGSSVMKQKEGEGPYICPQCFEVGSKSILNPIGAQNAFYHCNACNYKVQWKALKRAKRQFSTF